MVSTARLLLPLVCVVMLPGCSAGAASSAPATPASSTAPTSEPSPAVEITRADVEAAQRGWCDALVAIGAAGAGAKAKASGVLSSAYDYEGLGVLFKPTLTHGDQTFRFDQQGALAYFVGGDPAYTNDKGFALKPWVTCTPAIGKVVSRGDVAIAMGNVTMTDDKGGKVMVDKTFGYARGKGGELRIILHHSSLPFSPPK